MDWIQSLDFEQILNQYLIPWSLKTGLAVITFIVGLLVAKLLVRIGRGLMERAKLDTILVGFLSSILKFMLMLVVIIAALDQLGVDTTSMVALIGAAGLAVGLALQGSLQNFAAGVMLIVFRPFSEGDFVEAGGTSGVVEHISIFNTRMRTPDNKSVIVPNGKIFSDNIVNYSAKETRRVDMVFGIGYDDDLLKAKQLILDVLGEDDRILAEPEPLVAVSELGDNSVNFNVRPWVNTGDYWPVFYDLQEKIKLRFDDNGISIPYPQLDVHMPDRAA